MKKYNYSNVDNFLNGVFKVAIFTTILDVIFFIVKFHSAGFTFLFAFICGLIVFLVVFFYIGDGKISHHNIKGTLFYTSYGICCGYAFMQGFNQASK